MNGPYGIGGSNLIYPEYGLRDKQDQDSGLTLENVDKKIVVRDNLIFTDTRDCIGQNSLIDTQEVFKLNGGRGPFTENISSVTGLGIAPIVISSTGTVTGAQLKNGDKVAISGIQGNTAANGIWTIVNFTVGGSSTFELLGSVGNGNYAGGGVYTRPEDPGWPRITETTSLVTGNEMIVQLPKKLKVIRSLSLIHTIIPRDIIPLTTYLPDFLEFTEFSDSDIPSIVEVFVISTVNIAIPTGIEVGDIVDGETLSLGDRILLTAQAAPVENGIYIVQAVGDPAVRSYDMSVGMSAAIVLNYYVKATSGTNINQIYICSAAAGSVGVGALTFIITQGLITSLASYIPQEKNYTKQRAIGFYSTPISLFRTYVDGSFSLPNQSTPPPFKLWNPPVGGVTHQLPPYPRQTVPTYTSANFNVIGSSGDFYVILSGYGVYDLNDWTYRLSSNNLINIIFTRIARTLLLLAICTNQSYRNVDYISLITNSNTTSNQDPLDYYGYGDYQRFVPGPGLGMNYQPGTTDGADPTVVRADSPIPFPEFRGNVWGPYNSPGDRFQKLGLRDTIQDLHLNGDLSNLFGTSIIKPWVCIESIPLDITYGLDFTIFIPVTFGDIREVTNINILNAMRLSPNGFGALDIKSLGNGATFTTQYSSAGGQGPDQLGTPVNGYSPTGTGAAWITTGVNGAAPTFTDEQGAGSSALTASNIIEESNATTAVGDGSGTTPLTDRIAWYDLGANNGEFIDSILKYRNYAITELPDTNLVISIFQAERDTRVQDINQINTSCILNCPIRLNLGTTSGTAEYVENIQAFLAGSSEYWEKRYLPPIQSLYKLTIKFNTYNGDPIPLEKNVTTKKIFNIIKCFY